MTSSDRRAVAGWLLLCSALVFLIVVVGGVTRLTRSGLSIVEWQPLIGAIPPLTEAHWQELFAKYRETPEFRLVNFDMTLEGFKTIFWWEYVHRLWARLIGIVFAVPLAVFLLRGQVRRGLAPHLIAMFLLGGLQGALGWYMVTSGLSVRTDVSQYRLAAHFLAALAIYSYMFWVALTLLRLPAPPRAAPLRGHLLAVAALLLPTLTFGAFVAGLDGGLVYNSFPLMGGRWIPSDAFATWASPFEDPVTAQFIHRWLAMAAVASIVALWLRRFRAATAARQIDLLAAMALLQAGLGVATLLLAVPIPPAAAHQAGAVALWTLTLWALHAAR
jgi:cytochrome c oxidase assembly protein subunit 15